MFHAVHDHRSRALPAPFGAALIGVGLAASAHAAWPTNGVPLVQLPSAQENPAIATDGSGGAIVVWRDSRAGATSDIYAQRIDATGQVLWAANGLPVCAAAGTQSAPDVFPDGAHGAIVAWRDDRSGNGDVFAQRIDGLGTPQWLFNGIQLAASASNETFPTIISDLSPGTVTPPGFIVTYYDRALGQPAILKAQHVDVGGTSLWAAVGTGGVTVTASVGQKFDVAIASDGVGAASAAKGAVMAWDELRPGTTAQDIYAGRISANGVAQWGPEGALVCGLSTISIHPVVTCVGPSTVVVAWEDLRNMNTDVYAQALNSSGTALWTSQGVPVVKFAGSGDSSPRIVPDGTGGSLTFWVRNARVYGQRLNASGATQWDSTGVQLVAVDGAATMGDVVADGAGGAIVAWIDARNGGNDLYAQRMDAQGNVQWDAAGVALCVATADQLTPGLAADGAGGAIACWRDDRDGNRDVYAIQAAPSPVTAAPGTPNVASNLPQLQLLSANPGSGTARLAVDLPRADHVALEVVDIAGRRIRQLSTAGSLAAGPHVFAWDGRDATGAPVASGTYYVRMLTSAGAQSARVVMMR